MNNFVILSFMNSVCIVILFHIINNNFINNYYDNKKKYNKQLLILFMISFVLTYGCFNINDRKMLNNIFTNNLEINEGEPGF